MQSDWPKKSAFEKLSNKGCFCIKDGILHEAFGAGKAYHWKVTGMVQYEGAITGYQATTVLLSIIHNIKRHAKSLLTPHINNDHRQTDYGLSNPGWYCVASCIEVRAFWLKARVHRR
jgi:hypothetical protein